jgi:N6-L-threonylcarbamoyladenine synthase
LAQNRKCDLILAFETSCDDTSVAVVTSDCEVLSNIISSQPNHAEFGGVYPELASRLHLKNINYCLKMALEKANVSLNEINAITVTVNPGLIGSLIVGTSFAKSLAWSLDIPLIPVNHLFAHVLSNKIQNRALEPPFMALIVSGGHTELVMFNNYKDFYIIGQTLDDAAGEAFDKIAKILGLGFPGGPIIDNLAKTGNSSFYKFPRALNSKNNLNFSFSGLKTAVNLWINKQEKDFVKEHLNDIVASVQMAIIDALTSKTILAAKKYKTETIVLAGGVSANSCLRNQMEKLCHKNSIQLFYPKMEYCMDNAAMVAVAALVLNEKYNEINVNDHLSLNPSSTKGIKKI